MTRSSQGVVDSLDLTEVLEHPDGGTKFTFIIPTDVTGQTDERSILTLKNQLQVARDHLIEQGNRSVEVDSMLAPVEALLGDSSYWRLQSRSLVVYLADGFFRAIRVPLELPESLTISQRFNLLPLAPVLASDRKLYVFALSQNSIRLFDSSRNVIEELPLEDIPTSFEDVIDELPERTLDVSVRSAGVEGTPSFHGPDRDIDRTLLERFISVVAGHLDERLGTARSQLLVLAAVEEYLPIFRAASSYPAIFDHVIAGNPEHAHPDDLRSAAWALVAERETGLEDGERDKARSVAHGGKGAFDLVEIARAAEEGRVDTLFLPRDYTRFPDDESRALANRSLLATLRKSGTLRTIGELEYDGLATFRY